MRFSKSTALAVGIAAAAASPITGGDDDKGHHHHEGPFAPPITVTVTEKETLTKYEAASPVTHTITSYVGELYDQSYDNGYQLGDVVSPGATITETKTFSIAYRKHGEEKTSLTQLTNEWAIREYSSTTTVWVTKAHTNTIWVEPTPTAEATEDFGHHKSNEGEHSVATAYGSSASVYKPSHPHYAVPTQQSHHAEKPSTLSGKPSATRKSSWNPIQSPSASSSSVHSSSAAEPKPSAAHDHWHGKLVNTPDGTCGPQHDHLAFSCKGNQQGDCCSAYGHCGNSTAHCGSGCQSAFGKCDTSSKHNLSGRSSQRTSGANYFNLLEAINRDHADALMANISIAHKYVPAAPPNHSAASTALINAFLARADAHFALAKQQGVTITLVALPNGTITTTSLPSTPQPTKRTARRSTMPNPASSLLVCTSPSNCRTAPLSSTLSSTSEEIFIPLTALAKFIDASNADIDVANITFVDNSKTSNYFVSGSEYEGSSEGDDDTTDEEEEEFSDGPSDWEESEEDDGGEEEEEDEVEKGKEGQGEEEEGMTTDEESGGMTTDEEDSEEEYEEEGEVSVVRVEMER